MAKNYRQGALGALLDEYERACEDIKKIVSSIGTEEFTAILDKETEDPDCVSIQSVITHVINAGYGYVFYIRKKFDNPETVRIKREPPKNAKEACEELDKMMAFTEESLNDKYSLSFDDVIKNRFEVPWGQVYDFEQMLEHAIVHILRHRRQIEKFRKGL